MKPSIGRIVHYQLTDGDANNITAQRTRDAECRGNPVGAGQEYPAIITRIWTDQPDESSSVQLQVFLDGNDTYWRTSALQGNDAGQWHEPERV